MRAVVQRVQRARVVVRGETVGAIGPGLCVLLGVAGDDSEGDAERLAAKTAHLRIFENEAGKFDLSLLDIQGEVLVVSQFTLIADTAKGNRPSFGQAAPPENAERLYDVFRDALSALEVRVETGAFGARMQLELVNDGPATIVLDQ